MAVSAAVRKRTATVVHRGKPAFPIPDLKHARLAVQMESKAKPPLSAGQKATINAKARKFGVKVGGKPMASQMAAHEKDHNAMAKKMGASPTGLSMAEMKSRGRK